MLDTEDCFVVNIVDSMKCLLLLAAIVTVSLATPKWKPLNKGIKRSPDFRSGSFGGNFRGGNRHFSSHGGSNSAPSSYGSPPAPQPQAPPSSYGSPPAPACMTVT